MGLTKHREGSLKELLAIALPLMLSSLSVLMMVFSDRWFLAHYSGEAHNAAVAATTLGWAFIFGWMVLANISEVFVAQYNGAGLLHRLGEPVWQMIWLSIGSCAFFIPLSLWGTEWIYGLGTNTSLERDYFSIMLLFGPFYAMYSALCGFFVGQGKTRLVTSVVVVANIFNVVCDWILIFGIEGWIPSMGVKGAAIATSLATIFQCLILGAVFLNKRNRESYGTLRWKPALTALRNCVRVGLPTAVFVTVETLAFAIYYELMKGMGIDYITITGICQTMLILFLFFAEGVHKATATLVGNMIGAGRSSLVSNVMKAGFQLNLIFFALIVAAFVFGMPLIIEQFLPHADALFLAEIRGSLETCLLLMSIFLFFEGLRLQFAGALMAAGDTFFLFAAGSLLVWIMMLLPVYFFVVQGKASVEIACLICVSYSAIASLIYFGRVWGGKWRSQTLIAD